MVKLLLVVALNALLFAPAPFARRSYPQPILGDGYYKLVWGVGTFGMRLRADGTYEAWGSVECKGDPTWVGRWSYGGGYLFLVDRYLDHENTFTIKISNKVPATGTLVMISHGDGSYADPTSVGTISILPLAR